MIHLMAHVSLPMNTTEQNVI